jgi:hypothetical protein
MIYNLKSIGNDKDSIKLSVDKSEGSNIISTMSSNPGMTLKTTFRENGEKGGHILL